MIPHVGLVNVASLGLAMARLDRLTKRVPVDRPWETPGAPSLDAQTLGGWIDTRRNVPSKTARAMLHAGLGLLFSTDLSEVSLLGSLVLAAGGGSFQYYMDTTQTETHLVDGGAPELAGALRRATRRSARSCRHRSARCATTGSTSRSRAIEASSEHATRSSRRRRSWRAGSSSTPSFHRATRRC